MVNMEIDQLVNTLQEYRKSVESLRQYQDTHFPHGCVVRVSCERYKGFATVCQIDEVPPDKLGCRGESNTLWFYQLECCERVDDSTQWPHWLLRSRLMVNHFAETCVSRLGAT